jgi:streptogramin lyase
VSVRGRPTDVADIGDLAAVVSGPPAGVTIIDAQFGQISGSIDLPDAGPLYTGTAVAAGRDIWVANPGASELDRLSPPFTTVSDSVPLSGRPQFIAADARTVWLAGARTLWSVDPQHGRVRARIRLPFTPSALAAGHSGVWLVDTPTDRLVRLDPRTQKITARIRVGDGPVAVAVGAGSVWVANEADGTVSRVDPRRNVVERTIGVRSAPVDLEVGLGAVWVVRRTTR